MADELPGNKSITEAEVRQLGPSLTIRRFGKELIESAVNKPIIDVACGNGRNSVWLAHLGGIVRGLDIDIDSFMQGRQAASQTCWEGAFACVGIVKIDLLREPWPFLPKSLGGLVNVHFFHEPLLPYFERSLIPGGLLVIETVPGNGGLYSYWQLLFLLQSVRLGAIRLENRNAR